jgi:hypothetical protein
MVEFFVRSSGPAKEVVSAKADWLGVNEVWKDEEKSVRSAVKGNDDVLSVLGVGRRRTFPGLISAWITEAIEWSQQSDEMSWCASWSHAAVPRTGSNIVRVEKLVRAWEDAVWI